MGDKGVMFINRNANNREGSMSGVFGFARLFLLGAKSNRNAKKQVKITAVPIITGIDRAEPNMNVGFSAYLRKDVSILDAFTYICSMFAAQVSDIIMPIRMAISFDLNKCMRSARARATNPSDPIPLKNTNRFSS